MSEEKLYAVKNDEGKYCDFGENAAYKTFGAANRPVTRNDSAARVLARTCHGHVVTFVEEPKKVTVSPNEAKAIESLLNADTYAGLYDPFKYLFTSRNKEDIKRLIKAFKNGYTVAKEKKYNVKVPHTKEVWYYKSGDSDLLAICPADKKLRGKFTESEIEHYGLQNCECVEVKE